MDTRGVHEGMTVRSADGEKLGKVVACEESLFVVEKGFFFPKDYVARYEQVADVGDGEVRLRENASALTGSTEGTETRSSAAYETRPAEELGAANMQAGAAGDRTGERISGTREEVRVPLAEEELTAEKHLRDAGQVRITKEVVTEQKQMTVPVTREEVHVERVPASGSDRVDEAAFEERTISVPIREEEVEIKKRPRVREEVRVSKTARTEERRADAEVRHEEARVEKDGEVIREDPEDDLTRR
jgi:uncharacterized protein (TIGR02271 family)